jgi:hypothetical protein
MAFELIDRKRPERSPKGFHRHVLPIPEQVNAGAETGNVGALEV